MVSPAFLTLERLPETPHTTCVGKPVLGWVNSGDRIRRKQQVALGRGLLELHICSRPADRYFCQPQRQRGTSSSASARLATNFVASFWRSRQALL